MAVEENLVPPAKYIFLITAGLVTMMAIGGALGFSDFAKSFLVSMDEMAAWERGGNTPLAGPDGKVTLDLAIDMKTEINNTHGIVYWYLNVTVELNSTMADVMGNLSEAKYVELRIYDLQNVSQWTTVKDTNVSNYLWDVEYGNFSGFMYISSIGGVAEDPGSMKQWLTYRWVEDKGVFEYVTLSSSRFLPSNGDKIVLLYSELGIYPSDCCSGASVQYEDYTGPK